MCRYQFALKDAVDPALLQSALDAALSAAPYYRVQLVQEKREAFLEPNPNRCLVYAGSAQRSIPEETNGYLFSVSCEGDTVYFDWYHFLMDGRGVSPFLTRILELYCNLRYGTAFANTPIVSSPAYDIEAMMAKYPAPEASESTLQRDVVQTWECKMRRTRVRLTKQSLVDKAVANGVKPFTALAGLLCLATASAAIPGAKCNSLPTVTPAQRLPPHKCRSTNLSAAHSVPSHLPNAPPSRKEGQSS